MERMEAIEWLKSIKKKYIHGGDDFYDHQRRTAIDYAIVALENIEQPMTNADRIRAMSDEELADFITSQNRGICTDICREMHYQSNLEWLKQSAE